MMARASAGLPASGEIVMCPAVDSATDWRPWDATHGLASRISVAWSAMVQSHAGPVITSNADADHLGFLVGLTVFSMQLEPSRSCHRVPGCHALRDGSSRRTTRARVALASSGSRRLRRARERMPVIVQRFPDASSHHLHRVAHQRTYGVVTDCSRICVRVASKICLSLLDITRRPMLRFRASPNPPI